MQTYIAVYYSHTNNARKYTKKNILLCVSLCNLCATLCKMSHTKNTKKTRSYTKKNILLCVSLWNLCGSLWKNLFHEKHEDIYSAPMELIGTVLYIFYYDVAPTGRQR